MVVALCTIFVLAFLFVLVYEAEGIGNQSATIPTTSTTCPQSGTSCDTLTIASATIHTVNYTDELGTVNYATLSFSFRPVGGSPITALKLFIGNVSAGAVQGPFRPGVNSLENMTLPATVSVSQGKTYILSIEGSYGNGSDAWASTRITAE